MTSKRGQNSTIGVTIAIILGIALIVFLIWGFSTNWTSFRNTGNINVGSTNIDTIANACTVQYDSGFTTQFCQGQKDATFPQGQKGKITCRQLQKHYPFLTGVNVDQFCAPAPYIDPVGDVLVGLQSLGSVLNPSSQTNTQNNRGSQTDTQGNAGGGN